ncbi:MAG TPA: hypothetical protein VF773_03415 [Verrucomicrobiae bacterium]
MRLGRPILTFVLCLLWFGMPVHCQLEAISTANLFACSADADCADPVDKGCEDDFCNSLESGEYFPQKSFSLAKLPLAPIFIDVLAADFLLSFSQEGPASSADTVPLLTTSWHFVQRVAAPPRAPSCFL